jgi:membrane protein required for colicin V production
LTLDIILLILLALSAWNGWKSGAMAMIIAVVVLIVAALGASAFAGQVGAMLKVGPDWSRPVVGFIFTFVVLLVIGNVVKRAIRPKHGLLRGLDGLLGSALGLVRAVLVLGLLLGILKLVHLPPEHTTEHSTLYGPLIKTSTIVAGVLTPYVHPGRTNDTSV